MGRFVVYPPSLKAMTNRALGSSSTCSKSASIVTPRHFVSSFVHVVTHEMSTTKSCAGSRWNSSQLHLAGCRTSPSSVKVHFVRSVLGVGPADSTGKSVTRCCPGGMRSFVAAGAERRPTKPRVTNRCSPTARQRTCVCDHPCMASADRHARANAHLDELHRAVLALGGDLDLDHTLRRILRSAAR